jgi:hypothetical protein
MKLTKDLFIKIFIFSFSILFISGCSQSYKISDSWVNPDASKESLQFKKVAVFGLVMKTATRRHIEEELSKKLVNTIAVPAYKIISEDDISNPDVIKSKLLKFGFDGALVLRLVDVQKRESYSPGMYPTSYYSFGSYYGYAWGYMYNYGGTYITDQIVTVEVNIYSLKDDKLIWAAETSIKNPGDIDESLAELTQSVKNRLIEDGLLEKQPGEGE